MIEAKTLGPLDPVFTHVLPDGTNINIHSGRLRDWCAGRKLPISLVPVETATAIRFIRENIVDTMHLHYLAREIKARRLQPDPIILCKDGGFTNGRPDVLFVDGHHRYVIAAAIHLSAIPAYLLEVEQWKPFQVSGLPDLTHNELRDMPTTKLDRIGDYIKATRR